MAHSGAEDAKKSPDIAHRRKRLRRIIHGFGRGIVLRQWNEYTDTLRVD